MAITDESVIKYSNEQIRKVSENMRNLYYEMKSLQTDWFNGINALTPNESDNLLEDGRDSEGVNKLSGADINNIVTQVGEFVNQIEVSGVLGVIHKPCVRPLGTK